MTAPVAAIFHVESPYVLRNLRDRLISRKAELIQQLAGGLASDHEDYRYRIGTLVGLDEALNLIDELE